MLLCASSQARLFCSKKSCYFKRQLSFTTTNKPHLNFWRNSTSFYNMAYFPNNYWLFVFSCDHLFLNQSNSHWLFNSLWEIVSFATCHVQLKNVLCKDMIFHSYNDVLNSSISISWRWRKKLKFHNLRQCLWIVFTYI
jgi:hypothetical protein